MSQSQELINQELTAGGGGNTTTSFSTGSICPKTGLWKTSDGKIQVIEFYSAGEAFRNSPSGNGTKKCSWTRITVTSDGGKTSFDGVMVEAGTV